MVGCTPPIPAGADGDLLDDWPTSVEPVLVLPVVGQCYAGTGTGTDSEVLGIDGLTPLPSCDAPHLTETFHIGAFTGEAADAPGVPMGHGMLRAAYAECDARARVYLGDEWRNTRLEVQMVRPTAEQWDGGARHFRCDLAEVRSQNGPIVPRTGSVRDGLRGARPLAAGCFNHDVAGSQINDLEPVSCSEPHTMEYAGTFLAPEGPVPYDGTDDQELFFGGCVPIVSRYVGMTPAQLDDHRQLSYSYWWRGRTSWELGDRSATCFVSVSQAPGIRVSVKGLGNRKIPGT